MTPVFGFYLILSAFYFGTVSLLKCPGDDDAPEAKMTAEQLIHHNGYRAESHKVNTEDGYVLTLHRILSNKDFTTDKKPSVFLQHGLGGSSTSWFLNLPNQSLAFMLCDIGYDVWLGNNRGNSYSNEHISLFKNESLFWDFSWDNMAEYDLPAMINYVLNFTGNEQLVYVGHSQGTLIAFAKLSTDFNLAKKIKLFVALAPVTTVGDIKSHFKYAVPFTWSLQSTFLVMGYYSLNDVHHFTKYVQYNSSAEQLALDICRKVSLYISALDTTTVINRTRIPVFLGHIPDDTSMKTIVHYGQMVLSGLMQRYDYGFVKNYFVYGSFSPPEYKLDDFNVTTIAFWSPIDEFSSGKDIANLLSNLKNVKHFKINNFRHLDFLLSLNARERVYNIIVNILKDVFKKEN